MQIVKLVGCIAVCLAVGGIGGFFTKTALADWYMTLAKPNFTPPNWVFGPVWTALYVLMGIALYLVLITREKRGRSKGIAIFSIQMMLNLAWSAVFFGLRSPIGGLGVIGLLWVAIIGTIVQFHKISSYASWLLIPYWLWVTYAAALNYFIWRMN